METLVASAVARLRSDEVIEKGGSGRPSLWRNAMKMNLNDCCDAYEDYDGYDVAGDLDSGLSGTHVVGHNEKAFRPNVKRIKHGDNERNSDLSEGVV